MFSKDNDGCVPAAEIRFVLQNLVEKIKLSETEIEEMIRTVDKNRDGKISYSEFRVRLGESTQVTLDHALTGYAGSNTSGYER